MRSSHRFLVTVDCDLRCDDVALRQESLDTLLRVFAETGVAGHATWFANENDFHLTENHEPFLREALGRGDSLGVHDHIDWLKGRWEFGPIMDYCRKSRDTVQHWLSAHGRDEPLRLHRNGCLFQRPVIYAVLKELGYSVVSDVYPGQSLPNHTGFLSFDNRAMPLGAMPYRHDVDNFGDHLSTQGPFLHLPVMHMGIANFDFAHLQAWLDAFAAASISQGALLWLFHPYEVLNQDKDAISPERAALVDGQLRRLKDEYGVEFASVEEWIEERGAGMQ